MSEEKEYFVLTLPLKTEPWQEQRLAKALEVNRRIYNGMLREGMKRYGQMIQTRRYRETAAELERGSDRKRRKELYQELDRLRAEYRLRPADFSRDSTAYRRQFKENTDAPIVQNLAAQVSRAIGNLLDGNGEQVRYKPEEGLQSLSGKTNQTSIRYQDGFLLWKDLKLPTIQKDNAYEKQALSREIRYCRLKRKAIHGKYHYYAELVLKGSCPVRQHMEPRSGRVGLKGAPGSIVAVSEEEILTIHLPGNNDTLEEERRETAGKLERSRRALNPENYNPDGTIRKGSFFWKESINYRILKRQYAEIIRMQKVRRDEAQLACIEELLKLGDCFVYEEFPYQTLRYGRRAMEETAPTAFYRRFRRKAEQQEKTCVAVPASEIRTGRYNHEIVGYEAAGSGKRFRQIGGQAIETQCYGAFVLQQLDLATGKADAEACKRAFPGFLKRYETCRREYPPVDHS